MNIMKVEVRNGRITAKFAHNKSFEQKRAHRVASSKIVHSHNCICTYLESYKCTELSLNKQYII